VVEEDILLLQLSRKILYKHFMKGERKDLPKHYAVTTTL
jgi:hypothetical protein